MKDKWLEEGYRQFAKYGPDNLSINQISKSIGLSSACFYHYFATTDIFIDSLLERHWQFCLAFNDLGKAQCKVLYPDLYLLLGEYQETVRFNLKVFHNRHQPRFNYVFLQIFESSSKVFALDLFANYFNLDPKGKGVYDLWLAMAEAWYSRLDPHDLSAETMQSHSMQIANSMSAFLDSELYERMHRNGDQ
jgi:AcrR family transcriptional regulator